MVTKCPLGPESVGPQHFQTHLVPMQVEWDLLWFSVLR